MSGNPHPRDRDRTVSDIRDFLLRAESLPSPQGTAAKLIELAADANASMDDVLRVVQTDPALAGYVLSAARASRFHGMSEGLDLRRAVLRLGLDLVRAHAIALSLVNQRGRTQCVGFDYPGFWIGSLHAAILMERLAGHCAALRGADAFSLGLLGGIGRLALATAVPAEYSALLAQAQLAHGDLAALERERFGFDHHELSAVLLADWHVPTALADVVYWQRDPEGGGFAPGSKPHTLAGALQLACALSQAALAGGDDELAAATLRATILGIDPATMREVLAESMPALNAWAALVGLPVPRPGAADSGTT